MTRPVPVHVIPYPVGMLAAAVRFFAVVIFCSCLGPRMLRGQTFVQLADLDPNNQLGPRLTRTVVVNKLSGNPLFADLASKITLVDAVASPWVAYEFAADPMWN